MASNQQISSASVHNKIKQLKNCVDQALYTQLPVQTLKVKLVPNKQIKITQFIPITGKAGQFYAHPDTINAVREDIFAMGEELFDELESTYQCHSCRNILDMQFWKHCPFCQAALPH